MSGDLYHGIRDFLTEYNLKCDMSSCDEFFITSLQYGTIVGVGSTIYDAKKDALKKLRRCFLTDEEITKDFLIENYGESTCMGLFLDVLNGRKQIGSLREEILSMSDWIIE